MRSQPLGAGREGEAAPTLYYLTAADAASARAADVAAGIRPGDLGPDVAACPELRDLGARWRSGAKGRDVALAAVAEGARLGAWPAAGADVAELPEGDGVRVLARGVDTLHLCAWTRLRPELVDDLVALRQLARSGPVWLGWAGHRMEVGHAPNPYAVGLSGPGWSLRVARRADAGFPQVFIELRSLWLWRQGVDRAVADVVRMLRGWSQDGTDWPRLTVSRVDLAVDVQGWVPDGRELWERRWVSRAVARSGYLDGWDDADRPKGGRRKRGRSSSCEAHWRGLHFTGGALGSGSVRFRYYDKSFEIWTKSQHKAWMMGVWARSGRWDSSAPVWRLEVQFRGEALGQMVAGASTPSSVPGAAWKGGEVTAGKGWRAVRRALGGLWRYATGEWCTLRVPGSSPQRTRWDVDPAWRVVQRVGWGLATAHVEAVEVARFAPSHAPTGSQPPEGCPIAERMAGRAETPGGPAPEVAAEDRWAAARRMLTAAAALSLYGTGPSTRADAALVGAQAVEAEARADALGAQAAGCLASYAGALMTAGEAPDDGEDLAAWAVRRLLAEREGPTFAGRVEAARMRHGVTAGARYIRRVVEGLGDR